MLFGPVCEGTKTLGHSAPTMHWWLSLTATDQGTWAAALAGLLAAIGGVAAAIASFRAARVALDIARIDQQHRDEEELARARVIASYLFTDAGLLHKRCMEAIKRIDEAISYPDERAIEALEAARRIVSSMDVTKIQENLDKLIWLPARHATSFAAFPDMKKVISILTVAGGAPFPVPRDAHAAGERGRQQLEVMRDRLDEFIKEFEPLFAT